jgi:ACS family hexuronate transporter-like MFS transporter
LFWFIIYEVPAKHKRLSKEEFNYIHSDVEEKTDETAVGEKFSWLQLLEYKQTWSFAIGKCMTDGVWWFYLFWLPDFLNEQYKLSNTQIALPIALVYTIATVGSIYGGWLPMKFIKDGWPVYKARKTSMLIYALCPLLVISAQWLGSYSMWIAVAIIGFAAAAHQAWSANIFTTVSDMFPKRAVGSVIGIGGMAGGLGSIALSKSAGLLFDHYKALGTIETGYFIMFIFCGLAYLIGWLIMHLLVPRMKRIEV